ncbi:MAG: DUF2085 domain-containing protein [Chloroflexi bacterium]|nr:DUF2085 domain-containing protein [Chloroflexota bacterium]
MSGREQLITKASKLSNYVLWPVYALLVLAVAAALAPRQVLQPLDWVGYAVCHRIPSHSIFIANTQLPVCARDTGMFTGALIGIVSFAVVQRKRYTQFPSFPYVLAMAAFFLMWAFDGFNSYMQLLRGTVFIYPSANWLRLVTGAFMGVALSSFVVPLFNSAVWQPELSVGEPSIRSWRDMLRLVVIAFGIIVIVLWQPDFLYGPIALISALGVITLLVVVNSLLVILLMKREARYERWSQLVFPLVAGVFFALTEIMVIDIVRATLTRQLGLPY